MQENNSVFKDVDYLYHFAGKGDIVPSIEAPQSYMNTNTLGSVRVLECAKQSNIKKFLYDASSSFYGIPNKYPTP